MRLGLAQLLPGPHARINVCKKCGHGRILLSQIADKYYNKDMIEDKSGNEKEQQWAMVLGEIDTWIDNRGKGVDPGIKETLAGLRVFEIGTSASCEGHVYGLSGGPWVDVVAEESKRLYNELIKPIHNKRWEEGKVERREPFTPEERKVLDEVKGKSLVLNLEERKKLVPLLEEFNAGRNTPYLYRLEIKRDGGGSSRIESAGVEYAVVASPEERQAYLLAFQKEMSEFADFLKAKYLAGD